MKRGVLILFSLLISIQSVAGEKSVMQSILEEMSRKYLEESIKSYAIKNLEQYASQQLGQNLSGTISGAMAVLGLIEGVQNYDKATSETQRYMAFAQSSAAAVTLAAPPVGALVSLGVFVQGIGAALVSKKYSLTAAKLIKEISEIEKETSDIILKEANAEKTEFEALVARAISLDIILIENSKVLNQHCAEGADLPSLKNCLHGVFLQRKILSSQIYALGRVATYNGRIVNAALGLTPEKLNEIQEVLRIAEDHLQKTGKFIAEVVQQLIQGVVSEVRRRAVEQVLGFKCHRLLSAELSLYLEIKLAMEEEPEDHELHRFSLRESDDEVRGLLRGTCKVILQNLDADLLRILREYGFLQK